MSPVIHPAAKQMTRKKASTVTPVIGRQCSDRGAPPRLRNRSAGNVHTKSHTAAGKARREIARARRASPSGAPPAYSEAIPAGCGSAWAAIVGQILGQPPIVGQPET